MKKTFTILLSAIVLVASLGVTGAFADSVFLDQPIPVVNSTTANASTFDSSLPIYSLTNGNYVSGFSAVNNDVYVFLYPADSDYRVCFASLTQGAVCSLIQKTSQSSYNFLSTYNSASLSSFDSSSQCYYLSPSNILPSISAVTAYVPIFSTLSEGLASVAESAVPSVVGEWVNFSIKPGYVFVIEGECEILERSYYINNSWNFFGTNNAHRTNGSSERISAVGNIRDGFSVDYGLTRDQLIQWEAQNPNLVGDASIYEFYSNDLISLSSGSAFFISYPLYDGVQTTLEGLRSRENSVDLIGSAYLNYTTRPTFRYVALKSNIDASNKDVAFYNTLQPSITDSSGDVTETPDGTTISPGDIPSGGGDSSTPPLDEDNSLLGTISKFVNDIKRLLSTAVESINTLVAEGSQFMRSVAQMFTWLPEQLTSLLIAAFTILVVVGVLKVLWR